ncbi:hypothetical protein LBMAG53_18510 [Planctomycetota bacterium]|nr:hypothetical protein LBMAG53_18510 [Planctomycetota bacterium]
MTLRSLVPALGTLAPALAVLALAPVHAGDTPVTFHGWADTILSVGDDTQQDDPATKTKEKSFGAGFYAQGSLKVNWTVTDKLTAKLNAFINPGPNSAVNLREAYFTYNLGSGVSWSMGKYIDHMGWISAEPTGLYVINASLIGYTSLYGNDVVGTAVSFSEKEVPVSGSIHITNGYYSAADQYSRGTNSSDSLGRENIDLGYGLDLVITPVEAFSANAELAFDPSTAAGGGVKGGAMYVVGLNATAKTSGLTIGLEGMYAAKQKDSSPTAGKVDGTDMSRYQANLLVNYAIPDTKFPVSVSVQGQYIRTTNKIVVAGGGQGGGATSTEDKATTLAQGTLALLTNPLKDTNFGLNAELAMFTGNTELDNSPVIRGAQFSIEGIVAF